MERLQTESWAKLLAKQNLFFFFFFFFCFCLFLFVFLFFSLIKWSFNFKSEWIKGVLKQYKLLLVQCLPFAYKYWLRLWQRPGFWLILSERFAPILFRFWCVDLVFSCGGRFDLIRIRQQPVNSQFSPLQKVALL